MFRNFWKQVRDYAARKVAESSDWSVRCPNCVRWTYEMSGFLFLENQDPTGKIVAMDWRLVCGDCGHVSHWIEGPFGIFISIDKDVEKNAATV